MRKVKRLDDRALDALVAEKILGFVWAKNLTQRSDIGAIPPHSWFSIGARFLLPPMTRK